MHVDQADFVFETDFRPFGTFDVVLCPGLMYHVSKHVELLEKISEANDDILVIDTTLSKAPAPCSSTRTVP